MVGVLEVLVVVVLVMVEEVQVVQVQGAGGAAERGVSSFRGATHVKEKHINSKSECGASVKRQVNSQ